MGLLVLADSRFMAYTSLTMVGLGFGLAYISVPVVMADYFGRRAFATTSGVRMMITGIFNALSPFLTGMIYDDVKSYTVPFLSILVLCLAGAAAAAVMRRPVPRTH